MIRYRAMELHTHTLHSDGQFTVEGLCLKAAEWQYEGIALTDHNTMSGVQDLTPELEAATVPVIRGIEWTTFFGHMLVIGADKYVDWRFAVPEDIDRYIRMVKEVNGVVGLAHPREIGSPMVTGGYWMFQVRDWENVSYIEVWNEPEPQTKLKNRLAYDMWTDLLNQGRRLAATSGRDWHGMREGVGFDAVAPVTYLGLDGGEITTDAVRAALEQGRTYVTMGPALEVAVTQRDGGYEIGQGIPAGTVQFRIHLDMEARKAVWAHLGIRPEEIRVVHSGKALFSQAWEGEAVGCALPMDAGWFRVEVYGRCREREGELLAFTSPYYIVQ